VALAGGPWNTWVNKCIKKNWSTIWSWPFC
jgi:hypothetical protein